MSSKHLRHHGSLLERILHVGPHERGRVAVFWSATVLLETVIAASWTILLAIFIGRQGVERLDLLYGAHAIFALLGTLFFSSIFKRMSVDRLIFIVGGAAFFMFLATTGFASWTEEEQWRMIAFFTLYFIAYSYLLSRLVALNAALIYNRFGAAEAERVGPILESAYPVGDLIAGILIFTLAQVFSVGSIILFFVPLLAIFLLLWWRYLHRGWKQASIRSRSDVHSDLDEARGPLPFVRVILRDKFLACMAALILIQGLTFDLVEVQFASVVQDHAVVLLPKVFYPEERERVRLVREDERAPHAPSLTAELLEGEVSPRGGEAKPQEAAGLPAGRQAERLSLWGIFNPEVAEEAGIVEESEKILEEELKVVKETSDVELDIAVFAEALGFFVIIFSIIAILVRLFLMHRLTSHLGYVRTGMVHPVAMITSLIGAAILPSMWSVVVAQAAMEGTEPMFEEAIGGSQYAMGAREYEYVQSFQCDVLGPLASLLTAVLLVLAEHVGLLGEGISQAYLLSVAGIFLLILLLLCHYRKPYRNRVHRMLSTSHEPVKQSEALDIILQPGHRHPVKALLQALPHLKHHHVLLQKCFEGFGELRSPEAVPTLLEHLKSPHHHEQLAALSALLAYEELSHPEGIAALRERILEAFDHATHPDVKIRAVHLLGKLKDPEIFARLREWLKDPAHGELKTEIVAALSHEGTTESRSLLRDLLSDPSPGVRAQAVIGLWRDPEEHERCLSIVDRMLGSKETIENLWGVIAVGVARIAERWKPLTPFLLSQNRLLRFEAALNLGRLDRNEAVGPLTEILCGQDGELAHYAHRKIDELNNEVEEHVRARAEQRLTYKVALELQRDPKEWVEDYASETLKRVRDYYSRIDAHSEVLMIDSLLEERGESLPLPPMPGDLKQALLAGS